MLQWLYYMLQASIEIVSCVSYICCKCFIWMLHMLQAYITNVTFVSDVCCKSASCCNINRRRKAGTCGVRAEAKRTWVVPCCMCSSRYRHATSCVCLAACGGGRASAAVATACGAGTTCGHAQQHAGHAWASDHLGASHASFDIQLKPESLRL
jgi:hypothetical protein